MGKLVLTWKKSCQFSLSFFFISYSFVRQSKCHCKTRKTYKRQNNAFSHKKASEGKNWEKFSVISKDFFPIQMPGKLEKVGWQLPCQMHFRNKKESSSQWRKNARKSANSHFTKRSKYQDCKCKLVDFQLMSLWIWLMMAGRRKIM